MALRTKTVEYAFQSRNTSLTAATRNDFSAITLYIPETTSRTFRAARIMVGCRDTVTTATSLTSPVVGIKLGAAAFSDVTLGNPPANTGESVHYWFERDVTSYFTTNFGTGASQTCQVGVQFSGVATINITVKLLITYEYSDTEPTTLVKTVRIPMDSTLGALTATLAEVGTNQIPALDTFLPESSKVYRSIWIEAIYNEYTVGTANDAQLGMQIDSGTEHLTGLHESGMASAESGWYVWDQGASPVWSTGSVHAFKARSSTITTASTFNHVGWVLYVTYEYAASSSTVINSLVLALPPITVAGATASTDSYADDITLWVEEPGTITMLQSGILLSYGQSANNNFSVKIGAGTARTYTETSCNFGGECFLTQRCDSGGAGGSAWTLARGKNVLQWELYQGSTSVTPLGFDGVILLNYTSGKASTGEGAHNHSTLWSIRDSQASTSIVQTTAAQWFNIPETNWFRNSLQFVSNLMTAANVVQTQTCCLAFEAGSGELSGSAFHEVPPLNTLGDQELGWHPYHFHIARYLGLFDRWSNDPETERMDLEGSRRVRSFSSPASTHPLFAWLTYHSITFTASGSITGSGGGTVNLGLHDATTGDMLATGSRTGNGSYTLTWFDNTRNCYVDAREGATYLGRSDNGTLS